MSELGPWSTSIDDEGRLAYEQPGSDALRGAVSRSGGRRLVWGQVEDSLLFVEAGLADALARVWGALHTSAEAGEALAKMPVAYAERFRDFFEGDIDGCSTEDLIEAAAENESILEWPRQEMLGLLPLDVQIRFGRESFSGVSGPSLLVPVEAAADVVAALEAHGFECIEDQHTCLAACGVVEDL